MSLRKPKNVAFFALCTLLAAGCAVTPSAAFDARAEALGFALSTATGDGFVHRTYARPGRAATAAARTRLHVYFGGDGSPFIRGRHLASDPTPRAPLALQLMARDPHPSVYVGRPCYHGLTAGCEPSLWTLARYSEPVVRSMAAAVSAEIHAADPDQVVLIGYSGGGVLAVLVAERLQAVATVVTVAANLDVAAWTDLHGYSPLAGSIDPVRAPGARRTLNHRHFAGAEDANVPPFLHHAMQRRVPWGDYRVIAGFDHRCCWVDRWPELLAGILTAPGPAR